MQGLSGLANVHNLHTPTVTDNRYLRAVRRLFAGFHCADRAFIINPDDQNLLSWSRLESAGGGRLGRGFVPSTIQVNDRFLRQRSEPILDPWRAPTSLLWSFMVPTPKRLRATSSIEASPPGHRLACDWIVRLDVTAEMHEMGRGDMQVECGLARELFIKHELAGILRIKMEFVYQATSLLASGSNHGVQFPSQVFFMTWRRLQVNIEDDRSLCH